MSRTFHEIGKGSSKGGFVIDGGFGGNSFKTAGSFFVVNQYFRSLSIEISIVPKEINQSRISSYEAFFKSTYVISLALVTIPQVPSPTPPLASRTL